MPPPSLRAARGGMLRASRAHRVGAGAAVGVTRRRCAYRAVVGDGLVGRRAADPNAAWSCWQEVEDVVRRAAANDPFLGINPPTVSWKVQKPSCSGSRTTSRREPCWLKPTRRCLGRPWRTRPQPVRPTIASSAFMRDLCVGLGPAIRRYPWLRRAGGTRLSTKVTTGDGHCLLPNGVDFQRRNESIPKRKSHQDCGLTTGDINEQHLASHWDRSSAVPALPLRTGSLG